MTEWTAKLSTGNPLLDEHHKEIFLWLAELESAAEDQRTLFSVYAITRLKNYAREHFAAEENIMRSVGYPGLAEHKEEHAAFWNKLNDLQHKSIEQGITTDIAEFLKTWFSQHIAKTDLAYVPYLHKRDSDAKR